MTKVWAVLLAFLAAGAMAQDEPDNAGSVTVREGFLKGEEFARMSNSDKAGYAMGFVDALLVAPLLDAPSAGVDRLGRCVVGMSNKRVVTIFNKYLEKHPDLKQQSANVLLFQALDQACP